MFVKRRVKVSQGKLMTGVQFNDLYAQIDSPQGEMISFLSYVNGWAQRRTKDNQSRNFPLSLCVRSRDRERERENISCPTLFVGEIFDAA